MWNLLKPIATTCLSKDCNAPEVLLLFSFTHITVTFILNNTEGRLSFYNIVEYKYYFNIIKIRALFASQSCSSPQISKQAHATRSILQVFQISQSHENSQIFQICESFWDSQVLRPRQNIAAYTVKKSPQNQVNILTYSRMVQ
jgi:hypothetical protein